MTQINQTPHQSFGLRTNSPAVSTPPTIAGLQEQIENRVWEQSEPASIAPNFNSEYNFDTLNNGRADTLVNFYEDDAEPDQALTKRELLNNVRSSAEEIFGESGTKAIVGIGGIAHLATGGNVKFDVGENSKLKVSKNKVQLQWKIDF